MFHCKQHEDCHADALIRKFRECFPDSFDRSSLVQRPPTASELDLLAQKREEPASDDGSTADEDSPPKGAGWQGTGRPMTVGVDYTSREYCDGQALASPGRWPISAPRYPQSASWKAVVACFSKFSERRCTTELLMDLALGRVKSCPFGADEIRSLKEEIVDSLTSAGHELSQEEADRKDVQIDFRFLDSLQRCAEDPEVGLGKFALRVRVGPGVGMPRLPAMYRPKRRWRLASQTDPLDYLEEDASTETTWRENYASIDELTEQVVDVMEDQARRGQLIKLSEAEAKVRFLDLASLGANRKDKPGGVVSARVLFDGNHGLKVNTRTSFRDQERAPISSDLKRAMREKALQAIPTFALTADVSEAHRQIPVHPRDWHLLGCQVKPEADFYIKTVGTFGVASASYYWGRVASALGRLTQYLAADSAQTWHMVVADDYHLEAGGESYRFALLSFFVLCSVTGVPLSWHKTSGGDTIVWVDFELLHRTHHLGISERRAVWFTKWARETASSSFVHMARFEEGLGRIMYFVEALELERPFLGPLYKFMTIHPRNAVRRVPPFVSFLLTYLAEKVSRTRHYSCATERVTAARVDAPASDTRTGIGGWYPRSREDGRLDLKTSPRFSLEILEDEWPWVFAKSRKPSLVISTLEALAVLVGLKLQFGDQPRTSQTKVVIAPTLTENRGNGALLNKLMTTKFTVSAVLMEMATYMTKMSLRTVVGWAPREANREADKLANGQFDDFDKALRIPVTTRDLVWDVLPAALEMGRRRTTGRRRSGQGSPTAPGSRRDVGRKNAYVLPTLGEPKKVISCTCLSFLFSTASSSSLASSVSSSQQSLSSALSRCGTVDTRLGVVLGLFL